MPRTDDHGHISPLVPLPVAPAPSIGAADFAMRPPSQAWEQFFAPNAPDNYIWAWFKPPNLPQGLLLRIPDELYRTNPQLAAGWTMRRLLQTVGLEPARVALWHYLGAVYPGMNGTSPYFDAPIPPPVAGQDPNLVVTVGVPAFANGAQAPMVPGGRAAGPATFPQGTLPQGMAPQVLATHGVMPGLSFMPHPLNGAQPINPFPGMPPQQGFVPAQPYMAAPAPLPMPAAAGAPLASAKAAACGLEGAALAEAFERMDADWNASLEMERELARMRKQLVDAMARLKGMNRDLNGPERVHSDSQDKKDWQDARRLLRDASTRLWKYVKAHDIGDTSTAGRRKWFEETYEKFVVPRVPFEGLQQAERGFENHRKQVTTLHNDMSHAHSIATLDGERRAQQVMNRIQAKVREATSRKNFLGAILDT